MSQPGIRRRSTQPTTNAHRFVWATVVVAVALGGCSLLDEERESSQTVGADGTPTTSRLGSEQDAESARTALLTLSDFGPGWSEVPVGSDDPFEDLGEERDRRLSECTGSADSGSLMAASIGSAKAATGTFTSPDTDSTVEQSVGLAPDVASAAAGMTALEDPNLPACLQGTFLWFIQTVIDDPPDPSDTLPPGASIGDVTVARLNVAQAGDQLVAFRTTIPIQISGLTVTQYFDLVFVRSGRAVSQLQFGSVFKPFEVPVLDWTTAIAANRLAVVGVQ